MATESMKQLIASELRGLRKEPGQLDAAKLTSARAIVKGFGGDDPDVALRRLTDLGVEHAGDRDVAAAMASFGWGVHSEAALDRLAEYSERFYVDPRTVRRWSDEGIRKLTMLILGSAPWVQPRARLVVVALDDELSIGLDLRIPPNLRMDTPEFWIGKEPIEIRVPSIGSSPAPQRFRTGLEPIATLDELPIRIRVDWSGEKFPIYEAVTRGSAGIYFNSRIVFRNLIITVGRWQGAAQAR